MDPVRKLIAETAAQKGIDLKAISEALGKNHAYMQQFITRGSPRKLGEVERAIVAQILGLPETALRPPALLQTQAVEQAAQPLIAGSSLIGAADLPIYASVVGGTIDDAMTVTSEIIDYVKRPEPLANAKNGYGLYVIGTSMAPVYRPGDLALVHPNLPPTAGDDVILCGATEHGEHYAMIKHLVKATATKWCLRQYNPPPGEQEEFTLDKTEWPICHTVVGVYRKR